LQYAWLSHVLARAESRRLDRCNGSPRQVPEPDLLRLLLCGQLLPTHARTACGRDQPDVSRRERECLSGPSSNALAWKRRTPSSCASTSERIFPSPTCGRPWRRATWASSTPSRPAPPSTALACAASLGRAAACGAVCTATTPTPGR